MADEFPRVTLGLDEYMLVGSDAVLEWSAAQAYECLLGALEDPDSAREVRDLARGSGFSGDLSSNAAVAEFVASLIASGSLVPLLMPEPPPALRPTFGPPTARPDWSTVVPLSSLGRGTQARPEPTWIEITCIGRRAESYGGARVKVRLPDGDVRELALDDASCVRIDGIETGGTCWIELAKDAKRRGKSQRDAPLVRDAAATIVAGGAAIGVSTSRAHVVVVKEKRYVHSW